MPAHCLASDAAVPARTVRENCQVLEDTLLATLLRPFSPRASPQADVARQAVLLRCRRRPTCSRESPTWRPAARRSGWLWSVFCELRAWLAHARDDRPLTFWRTADGSEVDFVVGDSAAIEVKATGSVTRRDLAGLRRLAEETPLAHRIVVCREPAARVVDGIRILPVMDFLRALWAGDLLAE